MKTILQKLREKSTWAGVAVLVTAFGLPIPAGTLDLVGEAIGAIAGIVLILKNEKHKGK